ncbi:MAG TPA: hypothetical protein VG096_11480 [Bryobacteraceae bacterium]|jgi:hypothetical protein|nr:hypothetical protein [Bryobacteraceae bacterium]
MKRRHNAAIAAGVTGVLVAIGLAAAYDARGTPLWPGSRYTTADRDRAVRRGLFYIYSVAADPNYFRDWGADLMWAFHNIESTSGNRELSELAWRMGHERAREWRRLYPKVPPNASSDEIADLVYGSYTADLLGVPEPAMHEALRRAAARFTPADYLYFDPGREPPPADMPHECPRCGRQNARGVRQCPRCGTELTMRTRYGIFTDALIDTFSGDKYGIPVGGRYADVLRWVPSMRPYPARRTVSDEEYYDAVYSVTHLVYTYNNYNQNLLSPGCFPQEFAYLKANLTEAIRDRDEETLGEYMDSLQAFGMTFADPLLQKGVDYLLSRQNPDGSWGDPHYPEIYGRYHTTWTSLGGLQSFRWTRVLGCPGR